MRLTDRTGGDGRLPTALTPPTGSWRCAAVPAQRSPGWRGFLSRRPDDRPAGAPAESARRTPREAAERLRAVIVEDEAVILMELEDLLDRAGIEVVATAIDAAEAIRLAERERPDFLTMDINLPHGRDGISAALEIHARFGLRCLFISAYGDAESRHRAEAAQPLGWLGKPVSFCRLEAALETVRKKLGDA